jgi:hypothetical protein
MFTAKTENNNSTEDNKDNSADDAEERGKQRELE